MEKMRTLASRLNKEDKKMLLSYGEFLASRHPAPKPVEPAKPKSIQPKDNETVIEAMKRLSSSYHMLDKAKMLQDTYGLMLQHTLEGRSAVDVIAELEDLFRRRYDEYVQNNVKHKSS